MSTPGARLVPRAPNLAESQRSENLAGLVERVTFHNPDSGFCVLRVKARGPRELITVVGHAPTISAGEFVQATGAWVNDRTHGPQFKASFLRAAPPTTVEGIEKYLGSGMIRSICSDCACSRPARIPALRATATDLQSGHFLGGRSAGRFDPFRKNRELKESRRYAAMH